MNKHRLNTVIGVTAGIAVVALFFWFGISGSSPTSPSTPTADRGDATLLSSGALDSLSEASFKESIPGLLVATAREGEGALVKAGAMAAVHYIGRFRDGTPFDSSVERGEPLVFEYGAGQLIAGFEKGLAGMRKGEIRRIVVSPDLAYGTDGVKLPNGTVVIPPNATLIFDVLLVDVVNRP